MIEEVSNRRGASSMTIFGYEARCIFAFGLLDLWHVPSFSHLPRSLHFSRSYGSLAFVNLAHLDRFYATQFVWDASRSLGIIAGLMVSDHYPLKLNINFVGRTYAKTIRIPTHVFTDNMHRESITNLWSKYNFSDISLMDDMVNALDTKSYFMHIVSSSVHKYSVHIANLRRSLAVIHRLLEKHPTSGLLISNCRQVKMSLKEK